MSNFNHATSIDRVQAGELTQYAASLPLPHDISTACGTKAMAIAAAFHIIGIELADMQTARSYIPDLSAPGQRRAYRDGDVMRGAASRLPAFTERLKTGPGRIDLLAKTVEYGGARFAQAERDGLNVIFMEADDTHGVRRRWSLAEELGEPRFCNHTALAVGNWVVDPGYDRTTALTFAEWKECQRYGDAVIMSGGVSPDKADSLDIHTDLLSRQGLDHLQSVARRVGLGVHSSASRHSRSTQHAPSFYEPFMREYFNLEYYTLPDTHERCYANLLSDSILRREPFTYTLTPDIEASEVFYNEMLDRLRPAAIYQQWLTI